MILPTVGHGLFGEGLKEMMLLGKDNTGLMHGIVPSDPNIRNSPRPLMVLPLLVLTVPSGFRAL